MSNNSINNEFRGTGAEDAFLRWINASQTMSMGEDTSDSDTLKITDSTDPSSGNTLWSMTTGGERLMPLQPMFLGSLTTDGTNVTGSAANFTFSDGVGGSVVTEIFDKGGNFTPGTGTFVAPVDGEYYFYSRFMISNISAAMTAGSSAIVTTGSSAQQIQAWIGNPAVIRNSATTMSMGGGGVFSLIAADTVNTRCSIVNGAGDTADVLSNPSPTYFTYFCGWLVC